MIEGSSSRPGNSKNSEVRYSSTSSNGQPAAGLSQEIVENGDFSEDGKTFTYSFELTNFF